MFRFLRGGVISAVVMAGSLAVLGSSAGQAAGITPRPDRMLRWQHAVENLQVPGKGCFTASYPRVEWLRTSCEAAPPHPYPPAGPPARGDRARTVGNGVDYSAEISSVLKSASGSFDSVSPGSAETGQQNGTGPQVPNTFSLQLNAKPFTSPLCAGSPNHGCLGWQQFIYSTTFDEVFMQYWLLQYDTTCPAGWNTFMFPPPSTAIYCFRNSSASLLPAGPLTVAGLTGTTLTGKTVSGGHDSVIMTTGSGNASAIGADTVLHIANGWKGVEFAIVGDCCGTQAKFSAGTTIKVRTTVNSGTKMAPTCALEGFTGETNNLSLASAPAIGTASAPTIISRQASTAGFPSCAAADGLGDTHLTTFRDLLYDFQASGDFELATTGPAFTVQTRQVSGAPTWPNAAVNEGIATKIGKADVAICLAPSGSGAAARLFVNKKTVKLASGRKLRLPGGGTVSLNGTGNVYLISNSSGNSVQATINSGKPALINVAVGLGRWPETVNGLLANYRYNPTRLESRGGTVLTAPFAFKRFYNIYGNSWRVSSKQSLLTVCGKVTSGDPKNLMYAANLQPKLASAARAACVQAGVKVPALLDACTVDVAVLGNKKAARVYLTAPAGLIWGKILKP